MNTPRLLLPFFLLMSLGCASQTTIMPYRGIYAIRTSTGFLVVWNSPDAYMTIEVPGKRFGEIATGRPLIIADNRIIQFIPYSRRDLMNESGAEIKNDKDLLLYLARREGTYFSGVLDTALDLRVRDITLPNRRSALYWSFSNPRGSSSVTVHMHVNALLDSVVLIVSAPLTSGSDEQEQLDYLGTIAASMKLSKNPVNPDSISAIIRASN